MLQRKRGKIVVVGSATSLRGRKGGVSIYGAARGAQHGYMKNVAMEVAPYVNVNATAQTYVDNWTYWPMAYRETEEFRERMAENPAARLATGRECAQTVLFLAGPESDFFYGQIIPFAGGWTVSASREWRRRHKTVSRRTDIETASRSVAKRINGESSPFSWLRCFRTAFMYHYCD
jgi:NAD(P)-dependent dehydrogenase (short-subunit alcohol dehydrogenase family)